MQNIIGLSCGLRCQVSWSSPHWQPKPESLPTSPPVLILTLIMVAMIDILGKSRNQRSALHKMFRILISPRWRPLSGSAAPPRSSTRTSYSLRTPQTADVTRNVSTEQITLATNDLTRCQLGGAKGHRSIVRVNIVIAVCSSKESECDTPETD